MQTQATEVEEAQQEAEEQRRHRQRPAPALQPRDSNPEGTAKAAVSLLRRRQCSCPSGGSQREWWAAGGRC